MRDGHWGRLLGGLCLLSVLTLGQAILPAGRESMLRGAVLDAGHVPLFGLVALLALGLARTSIRWRGRRRLALYPAVLLLVALLGLGTEFLQKFGARDADFGDLGRDLLGGLAALLAALAFDRRSWPVPVPGRILMLLVATVLAVAGMSEFVGVWRDYRQRAAAFPALCGFDSAWERRFVHGQDALVTRVDPPAGWVEADGRVGRLDFGRAAYPGLILREPVADWSDYAALEFAVWSAAPVELVLRVHDRAHDQRTNDRFNRRVSIAAGANRLRFPLEEIAAGPKERRLDLRTVAGVAVFADRPQAPFTVWLDDFRLVGRPVSPDSGP